MAATRNALFLAFDGRTTPSHPPIDPTSPYNPSTGIFVSNGTTSGTHEALGLGSIPDPPLVASAYPEAITAEAALSYNTVFGVGTTLYATNPQTGVPAALAVAGLASAPTAMISLGAFALFSASDAAGNSVLWRTDGTGAGTFRVVPAGTDATLNPRDYARICSHAVFLGTQADGSFAVFTTDGTSAATNVLLPLGKGYSAFMRPIGIVGGRLVFNVATSDAVGLPTT